MAEPQYLVDPSGQTVEVRAEDVPHYSQLGYLLAHPEQVAKFHAIDRASTPVQTAIAAAEGLGRGATFGASTWAERGLGVDPAGIQAREEANPLTSGIAEVGGTLLPAALTGGSSLLEEGGAKVALETAARNAPTSLLSRGAHAAATAAGRLAPEGVSPLARIVQRGIPAVTGSAIEGAAYGLGHDVHEAALGDPNVTAENILTDMGLSGVLAGGLGGLLGVGIPTAASAARRAHGNVMDTLWRHAPEFVSAIGGHPAEDVRAIMNPVTAAAIDSGTTTVSDELAKRTPTPEGMLEAGPFHPNAPPEMPPEVAPLAPNEGFHGPIQSPEARDRFVEEFHEALGNHDTALNTANQKQFGDLRPREVEQLIGKRIAAATALPDPVDFTLDNTRAKSIAQAAVIDPEEGYVYRAASPEQIKQIADSGLIPQTNAERTGEPHSFGNDRLDAVMRHMAPTRAESVGLSFVPDMMDRLMADGMSKEQAHKALIEAHRAGLIELRPESGLSRLSREQTDILPNGPQGTKLSWARQIGEEPHDVQQSLHMRPADAVAATGEKSPVLLRVKDSTNDLFAARPGEMVTQHTIPPESIEARGSDGQWHPVADAAMTPGARLTDAQLAQKYAPTQQALAISERMKQLAAQFREQSFSPSDPESHFARKMEKYSADLEKRIAGSDPVETWKALNELKKDGFDPLVKWARKAPTQTDAAVGLLKGMRETIRQALEDQNVWGEAGARQAATNNAFYEHKQDQKAMRSVLMSKQVVRGNERWTPDAAKINAFVKNIAQPSNATKEAKVAAYFRSARGWLDQIDESAKQVQDTSFDRDAYESLVRRGEQAVQGAQSNAEVAQKAQALRDVQATENSLAGERESQHRSDVAARNKAVKQAMKEFKGTETEREKEAQRIADDFDDKLKERDKDIAKRAKALEGNQNLSSADAFGVVGSIMHPGATPFYAAYRLAKSAQNPVRMTKVLSTLERLGHRTTSAIEDHVDSFLGSRAPPKSSPIKALSDVIEPRGEVQMPNGASPRVEQYMRDTAAVQDLAEDPAALHQAITAATEPLMEHAPETAMALGLAIQRSIGILAAKIPQHSAAGPMDAQWHPSGVEMAPFERTLAVINGGPKVVAQKLADGTLTLDHVMALDAAHPAKGAQLKASVLSRGGRLTPQKMGLVSMLTGKSMTRNYMPQGIVANQVTTAMKPQPPPAPKGGGKVLSGGSKNLKISEMYRTPAQRSAEREK